METDLNAIGAELDALHTAARKAFCARDIKGYAAMFTDDLRYVQPDGKAIGLWQLMRDVGKQLRQFKSADSEVVRESLTMNGDGTATAVLRQKATYSVSIFLIFTKTWKIERRGKYTYRKTAAGWQVADVEVLAEAMG